MQNMKLLLIVFVLGTTFLGAQETQKLESFFSVKAGLIGVWAGYEFPVSKSITIETEIGYQGGLLGGTCRDLEYIFTSNFSAEPRYYYNFFKRIEKGKMTRLNSANFLALELSYFPNLLTSTNKDNIKVEKTFNVIPKWGLRRSLSSQFFFDFAIGIGVAFHEKGSSGTGALDIKFGYAF